MGARSSSLGVRMRLKCTVVVASAFLAWTGAAFAAEERMLPCKNHYILNEPCPLPDEPVGTVRITKLFSTVDAAIQSVELDVVGAADQPVKLSGRKVTVRDRRGVERSVALKAAPLYFKRSRVVFGGSAWGVRMDGMLASQVDIDHAMPGYFLPIDGGQISIEGLDTLAFSALPTDGRSALARDGSIVPAFVHGVIYDEDFTFVSEFYNAELDHYFMTNRADEIVLLESGAIPGWQPTGHLLYGATRPIEEGYRPVCRYLLERESGYSHFFSVRPDECAALAGVPGNVLETAAAFYVGVPVDGGCAAHLLGPGHATLVSAPPVYRLWNGKPHTNHRFVKTLAERDAMVARGWISEGEGPDGVAMCAWWHNPPAPD